MLNLFSLIDSAAPEDVTTEFLAYTLRKFPPCRSAFLSLVGVSANSDSYEVMTQYAINEGRPDLVLCDKNQGIILVENKPWDSSSFTYGDQMKRYADHLKTRKEQKKTLCLLATERNKSRLMEEAKVAADINFVIITWEDVFRKLEAVCSGAESTVASFLLKELQVWMFPPVVEIPPEVLQDEGKIWENWTEIKTIIRQARNIAENDPSLSGFIFMTSPGQTPKANAESVNYFGYYIYDQKSGLCTHFGANMCARRFLKGQSLFVLQVRKGWGNASGGKTNIDFDILKRCGFAYDEPLPTRPWWEFAEYVSPLTNSSNGNAANPEALAKALAEILKKMSAEINK